MARKKPDDYVPSFVNQEDKTERLGCDVVSPRDIKAMGMLLSKKREKPHFLYCDRELTAGQVIDNLPAEDWSFNEKKRDAYRLADTYQTLTETLGISPDMQARWARRVKQVSRCADVLVFEGDKLINTLFCKVRLCPMCAWRRAIKISMHTREILTAMLNDNKGQKYKFLFLTLTVRNVWAGDLKDELKNLLKAWRKMTNKTKNTRSGSVPDLFNASVLGWYRGLEVTRNMDKYCVEYIRDSRTGKKKKRLVLNEKLEKIPNPWYLSYHPHFHCILVVPENFDESLLTKPSKPSAFLEWWRWATGDNTITQVDCKEFKPNQKILRDKELQKKYSATDLQSMAIVSGVVEAAKYTVKSSDYMLDPDATETLDLALERRQLVAYGGIMSKYRNLLCLDDEVDGDLISDNITEVDVDAVKRTYAFSTGFNCYIRVDNL